MKLPILSSSLVSVWKIVLALAISISGSERTRAEEQVLPGKSWVVFSRTPGESAVAGVNASGEISFQAVGKPGESFSGVYQSIPCAPGEEFVFRVDIQVTEAIQNGRGQISIEWKDAKGGEIIRSFGPVWGANFGEKQQGVEMTAVAPDGAASAAIVVTLFEEGGAKGAFEVSGVALQR